MKVCEGIYELAAMEREYSDTEFIACTFTGPGVLKIFNKLEGDIVSESMLESDNGPVVRFISMLESVDDNGPVVRFVNCRFLECHFTSLQIQIVEPAE